MPGTPRQLALRAGAAVTLLLLAGCARPAELVPAPSAADPECARIVMATPDELGGLERRPTTAQAATAWGDPAVTVRCGVEPPGPTTDRCLNVEAGDGTSVDWIALGGDDDALAGQDRGGWAFVTYGREPAVEVVVPAEQAAGGQPTAFLVDLAGAVSIAPADRHCVGATDVR